MSQIDVTLQRPESLVKRAQALGLLDSQHIAQLLQAELDRAESWQQLDRSLAPARALFRQDYSDLDEQDVAQFIHDVMHDEDDRLYRAR